MNRKAALGLALNVAVIGAFVWAFQHYVGWHRLVAPWRDVAMVIVLIPVAGMLVSYALRALRIYLAETAIPRGRYLDCLRLILINNVVNLMLPSRTGEASFPILMRRWFGIDAARATGTLIWLRLLDLHVLATVGGICAAFGWIAGDGLSMLIKAGAITAALAPLALFSLHSPLSKKLAGRDGRLALLTSRILSGVPNRFATLGMDLCLTWAAWLVKLGALGVVISQLSTIPLTLGVLGAIGGDLSTVLPVHAPGGIGTYELGAMALLAPGASPGSTGSLLAAVVNLHLLILTTALLAGVLAWLAGARPSGRQPSA